MLYVNFLKSLSFYIGLLKALLRVSVVYPSTIAGLLFLLSIAINNGRLKEVVSSFYTSPTEEILVKPGGVIVVNCLDDRSGKEIKNPVCSNKKTRQVPVQEVSLETVKTLKKVYFVLLALSFLFWLLVRTF